MDIATLARVERIDLTAKVDDGQSSILVIIPGFSIALFVEGASREADIARLSKKKEEYTKLVNELSARLSAADYLAKAKPEIQAKEKAKLDETTALLRSVDEELKRLQG